MARLVSHRSRISAPAAAVWEVVADPFRWPEWMSGVTGVHGERQPGQPGRAEQPFALEGRAGFWRFTAREKVTAAWPGTMVAFRGEAGPASFLLTLTLSELDEGSTSLAWNMEVRPVHEPLSFPARLILLLIRRTADCLARRSLANLQARLGRGR